MSLSKEPYLVFDSCEEDNTKKAILEEVSELSFGDKDSENLLIHGDNLPTLKALEKDYSCKVKCCYLDPPYNTGAILSHYDDNASNANWLSMMKERLIATKPLLRDDGIIAVQIGFDEMAYLKVLMDMIFGRSHCIGQIAVRMSHSAGMKRKASDKRMIKNTEYILMYYNETAPELHPLYEACSEYPVNYYQYIYRFPKENDGIGIYVNLVDVLYKNFTRLFRENLLKPTNKAIPILFSKYSEIREFIMENKERIVRKDSNVPHTIDIKNFPPLQNNEYKQVQNKNGTYNIGINSSGKPYQLYSIVTKVKTSAQLGLKRGEKEVLTNLVGDWWDGFYRDMSRVDLEGGVKMKTSKKPERLIEWILTSTTNEGDLVLDAFLGSGTTAAVALKMNRKFIGIEMGDQCKTLCLERLQKVIEGDDNSGISKKEGFSGGGGFKFFEIKYN